MKLYGVFLGIDHYQDTNIPDLRYAASDARAFYELVKRSVRAGDADLRLLTDEQVTRQVVRVTLGEELSRVIKHDDVLLFYFAGHGSPEAKGSVDKVSRYLILHDTEYEKVFSTGLSMESELPLLCFGRIEAKLIVLFVDACFSGRSGGRTFRGPQLVKMQQDTGLRGPIKLDELDLGAGRMILAACDDDELARENHKLRHGVFTHYLIQSLTNRPFGEKSISIPGLYAEVSERVAKHTHGHQNPILKGKVKLGQLPVLEGFDVLGTAETTDQETARPVTGSE